MKARSYAEFSKSLFTWLIEYPMLLIYYIQNIFKRPAIDRSLGHKMITQFWVKDEAQDCEYLNFNQGRSLKVKHLDSNTMVT